MRPICPKRIVVKIGTNTLCGQNGKIDQCYLDSVADQIASLREKGTQCLIVSSGAVGSGSTELGNEGKMKSPCSRQVCASVGQGIIISAWREAFKRHGLIAGQVLLTYVAFSDEVSYINLKNTINEMFSSGIVPIVNENDVIVAEQDKEIFGNNDRLSALVASKVDADMLVLLTDVDGLFDRDPRKDADAKLITTVEKITRDIERMAGSSRNERAIGGMKAKIDAAKISVRSGCDMIVANGRTENIILRLAQGEELGTMFKAVSRYNKKERWIMFAYPLGKLVVDKESEKALRSGHPMVNLGILAVEGTFMKGDIVRINSFAKAIVNLASSELISPLKKVSDDMKDLELEMPKVVVRRGDAILYD